MTDVRSVIHVENLVKAYGSTRALDGLDLDVAAGEVHGFLGPNGAGKSTTLKALLGLIRVDSGTAVVLGQDPWKDAVSIHRRLAYVPGDVTLWPRLTGGEAIDLLGRLRGGLDERRRDDLIARFDFDPTKKGRAYSKGNRQKVALIAAFASDVDLLMLDEPTSGLDPLMEQVFRECLAEVQARGTAVLLSSHILFEVEQLADRVTIIKGGRRLETGSLDELRHLTRTHVVAEAGKPLSAREAAAVTEALADAHAAVIEGARIEADVDPGEVGRVIAALQSIGTGLVRVTATPASLEQLFLTQYERDPS